MRLLSAFFVTIFFALAGISPAFGSERIEAIFVENNKRVEDSTIKSYIELVEGDEFQSNKINRSIKNLFATGLFSEVYIDRSGNNLVVNVVENPVINQVAFEGNSKIKDKDLEKEVSSKTRDVYTRSKLQQDTKRIQTLYHKSGRYSVKVEPKVIPLEQNRVNVVFEIQEGSKTKINQIHFVGNKAFSNGNLRKIIHSQTSKWYSPFSSRDAYDTDKVAYDRELLRKFYQSKGYADFKVTSSIAEMTKNKENFILTFNIEEGQKYNFGEIEVASSLPDVQKESIEQHVVTKEGTLFNADEIEASVTQMTSALNNLGYAFVDIQPLYKRDAKKKLVNLSYRVKEGQTVYIGNINIEGNVRTMDRVVRREMRLAEGDPYNADNIRRSTQRIRNLGYFEKVDIKTEPDERRPDRADVKIEVTEQSTGEINFGAGFSSVNGALGSVSLRERNLLGRGQDLRVSLQKSARTTQIDLGFTEPYFLGRNLAAGFDIFNIASDYSSESGFDSRTMGGRLRTGYSLSEHLRHALFFSYRDVDITDISDSASTFVRRQEGRNITSSIGHTLTFDKRDNRFDPRKGYYILGTQEFAGVGGDSEYLKHELRGAYFVPVIWDNLVFSLSGRGGHLLPYSDQDVRINERFFVGSQVIRGFDVAGIGPRDTVSSDALGGNVYYAASAEFTFPLGLPEELGLRGAAFIDTASLFDTDDSGPTVADDNSLRASYGVGLYWKSPIGPIRVDLANAFLAEDYDDKEAFRLNFGTRF